MIERNVENIYYVYVYLDISKPGDYSYGEYHFDYEPFYIGKGKNGRNRMHLKGCIHNKEFTEKINEIKEKTKFNPLIKNIWENLNETDAYHIEWKAINTIGTLYSKSRPGPLYNKPFITFSDIKWIQNKKSTTYILKHPYVSDEQLCSGRYEFIRFCKKIKIDYNELIKRKTINGWKLEIF